MNLSIEIIIVVLIILLVLAWTTWFRITTWWAKRGYKPENDRARKYEEGRGDKKPERPNRKSDGNSASIQRLGIFEPAELLPSATPIAVGQNSDSNGKTGKGSRNFFNRIKRK